MAYRLDKSVIRGEISNFNRNQVTGKIWLVGLKDPVILDLEGNCLRDLAGCTLSFVNPHPRPEQDVEGLDTAQLGWCGEMTASQKRKIPLMSDDEWMDYIEGMQNVKNVKFRWANVLYLEWFSEANGRVVIEASDFQMKITEPLWTLSPAEELEQIETSRDRFNEFLNDLAGLDLQAHDDDDDEDEDEDDDDEDDEDSEDSGEQDSNAFAGPSWVSPQSLGPVDFQILDSKSGADANKRPDVLWDEFLRSVEDYETSHEQKKRAWERERAKSDGPFKNGDQIPSDVPPDEMDEILRAHLEEMEEMEEFDLSPLNEFEWEQEFRAADRKAAAYQEAFDRYRHHPDREKLIAEAMGWEMHEIDDLPLEWQDFAQSMQQAPTIEGRKDQAKRDSLEFDEEIDSENGLQEMDDEDSDNFAPEAERAGAGKEKDGFEAFHRLFEGQGEQPTHPLSRHAMRFALKLQEDAETMGLLNDRERRDSPLLAIIISVIAVGGKLAAALDGVAMGYEPDRGFIIAMLKRAQIPLNEALHAISCIEQSSLAKDAQMWIATVRSELFDLRKDVLDVMKTMREA